MSEVSCCARQTLDEFQRAPQNHINMIIKFSNILIGCISDNIIREFYRLLASLASRKSAHSFPKRKTRRNKKTHTNL